jgi:solute carrier family 35 (UDP-sugar transporter), member A1/2/3
MTESRFSGHQRRQPSLEIDEENASLLSTSSGTSDRLLIESDPKISSFGNGGGGGGGSGITAMGLKVLVLLAVQNSSKNLLMRYVMKEKPNFLTSAAVIGSECTKLTLSTLYILLVERKSFASIIQYFNDDWRNTLLVSVPASAYNLQMTLEYIALANLDAAMFSVLVQTKLLFTATFASLVLAKKLKYIQVISLVLLTVGVMLCNMRFGDDSQNSNTKGILATLGIAVSSGFASVYTEKVIKTQRQKSTSQYTLAYTQVQLASMSLVTMGLYACLMDFTTIMEHGLFHNFNRGAFLTVFNSAIGGLIVAGVLKYADSVLKGYATAISVIMTGLLSMALFGTQLHVVYFLGIVNVVLAVLLYNGKNLEEYICL